MSTAQQVDGIDFLLSQHQEVRGLFTQLAAADGDVRKCLFQDLVRMLAVHETAEEEVLYPAVRAKVDNGNQLAEARLSEEGKAKQMLADLEKIGPESPEFTGRLRTFESAVDEHASHEEQEVFPKLRSALDDKERAALATALQLAERTAPTHPHPHGPDGAVGNLVVGPFVAIADRVRDALRNRSHH